MKQFHIISPPLTQDDLFSIAAARARIQARQTLRLAREVQPDPLAEEDYHPAEVYESERVALAREYGVSPWGPPDCGPVWKP